MSDRAQELLHRFRAGEKAALARAISWAENAESEFPSWMAQIWPKVGHAQRVGITGPPGAGKSTLVNELARLLRLAGRSVGILAVDPSSPFSGGALLGDRIRMQERALDPGVYIRSMASRESHGGLAQAAVDACDAMDAFGLEEILIETVGVGQAEYDIVSAADTILVVLCPGAGDAIQAMKAGLLEVADVLVVNKADLPGAERLASDLTEAVHIRTAGKSPWTPPVVPCSAGKSDDVELVVAAIEEHRSHLRGGRLEQRRRLMRLAQIRRVVGERLDELLWHTRGWSQEAENLLAAGRSPYDVAGQLYAELSQRVLGGGACLSHKEKQADEHS